MINAQNQPKVEGADFIPTPEVQKPEAQTQPSFLERMANFGNDPDIFKKLDQELNPNPQPPGEFKMTFFEKLIQPFDRGFWDRYAVKLEEHTRQEDAYAELVAETNRKKEQLLNELSKAQEQSTVQVEKAATRLGETPPDITTEQQTIQNEALTAQQELDAEVNEIMANMKAQAENLQTTIDANEANEQAPKKEKKKKLIPKKAIKTTEKPTTEQPLATKKESAPEPLNFEDFKKLMNKSLTPGKWIKIGVNAYALDKNGRIRVKPANQEGIPGSYISKNRGGINELAELENKFIVAQILSKQINPGEWIKHGKHEYTTDKSGKLRVKTTGMTGIPGSYLTKQDLNLLQKELGVNVAPQLESSSAEASNTTEEAKEPTKKKKTRTPQKPKAQKPLSKKQTLENNVKSTADTIVEPEMPKANQQQEKTNNNQENRFKEFKILLDNDMNYIRTVLPNLKKTKYKAEASITASYAESNYQIFQRLPELGYTEEELMAKQEEVLENVKGLKKTMANLSTKMMDDAVSAVKANRPLKLNKTSDKKQPPSDFTI